MLGVRSGHCTACAWAVTLCPSNTNRKRAHTIPTLLARAAATHQDKVADHALADARRLHRMQQALTLGPLLSDAVLCVTGQGMGAGRGR